MHELTETTLTRLYLSSEIEPDLFEEIFTALSIIVNIIAFSNGSHDDASVYKQATSSLKF